ncbi:MAG: glycosyltransferase [Thermoplasmatales archaeon]|nr:glycosyltransferase [Thermoplasmatales archaeon]
MKKLPKISIVTPSLNQGQFIEQTILSVLNQNYPKIEYIVMDGGSTDNTLEILKKYENRLIWESGPDTGQSDAINKGFRMATGEILAWLNSDDFYEEGAFLSVAEYFCQNIQCGVVYGNLTHVDESGQYLAKYEGPNLDQNTLIHVDPHGVRQQSTFFHRNAVEQSGFLDEKLEFVMDYELLIRLGDVCRFCFVDKNLAFFRIRESAKSVSMGNKMKQTVEILRVSRKYGRKLSDPILFNMGKHLIIHFLRFHTKDYISYIRKWKSIKRTLRLRG